MMEQNSDESTMRKSNQKVRVEGVRRVWGTLKETTASSLKSTIMKFSPSATLFVKRKTVRNDAGEIKTWWYVLHDSEEVLKVLEEKWEGLQMHTGWKLELCFRPHHATDSVKANDDHLVSQQKESDVQTSESHSSTSMSQSSFQHNTSVTSSNSKSMSTTSVSPFLEK